MKESYFSVGSEPLTLFFTVLPKLKFWELDAPFQNSAAESNLKIENVLDC